MHCENDVCEMCEVVGHHLSFKARLRAALLERDPVAVRGLILHTPEDLLKMYVRENPKMLSEVLDLDGGNYTSILEKISELSISRSAFGLLVRDSCGVYLLVGEAPLNESYHLIIYQPSGVMCDHQVLVNALKEVAQLDCEVSAVVRGKGSKDFQVEYCLTMASLLHKLPNAYDALGELSSDTVAHFLSHLVRKSEK